jgi:hypothetical protein
MQNSSAGVDYIKNIIFPKYNTENGSDQFGFFFMTPFWIFIFAGVAISFSTIWKYLVFLSLLIWASSGIHFQFAQLMYVVHFPFVSLFRQWYHFFPYIHFCLSTMVAIGCAKIIEKFPKRVIPIYGLTALVCAGAVIQGRYLNEKYASVTRWRSEKTIPRFSKTEFNAFLRQPWGLGRYDMFPNSSLFIYKVEDQLLADCKAGVKSSPTDFMPPLTSSQILELKSYICNNPFVPLRVIADLNKLRIEPLDLERYRILPDGLAWEGLTEDHSILLLPMSNDFSPSIVLNGKIAPYKTAYAGAYLAVPVENGVQQVEIRLPNSNFEFYIRAQWISILVLVLVCGYVYASIGKERVA